MVVARLKERIAGAWRKAPAEDPFDPAFFSRLDRIRLRFGRVQGRRSGETPVRGLTQSSGIEVESFKAYAPGDDVRYIDWNAVGRLDQLVTRRFVAEREIPVHCLLDASASMGAPAEDGKFSFARQLVAAVSYVALNNNESVRIAALHVTRGGPVVEESSMLRHRGRYGTLQPFLAALAPDGATAIGEGVSRYLERHPSEGGVVFVVSDFLVESPEYENALVRLRARRLAVNVVHVVGRRERDLEGLRGRFRLRDVETGVARDVALSESDRRRYRSDFERRIAGLRSFCHRNAIGHALAVTEEGVEHCLTSTFAREGMLRLR